MPWIPQIGSQATFLDLRGHVDEIFLGGDRGGAKTTSLLLDYAADVMRFGASWRGVIFRRESTEFQTIIDRSWQMFKGPGGMFLDADYLSDPMLWRFKNGASLQFVHMYRDSD